MDHRDAGSLSVKNKFLDQQLISFGNKVKMDYTDSELGEGALIKSNSADWSRDKKQSRIDIQKVITGYIKREGLMNSRFIYPDKLLSELFGVQEGLAGKMTISALILMISKHIKEEEPW